MDRDRPARPNDSEESRTPLGGELDLAHVRGDQLPGLMAREHRLLVGDPPQRAHRHGQDADPGLNRRGAQLVPRVRSKRRSTRPVRVSHPRNVGPRRLRTHPSTDKRHTEHRRDNREQNERNIEQRMPHTRPATLEEVPADDHNAPQTGHDEGSTALAAFVIALPTPLRARQRLGNRHRRSLATGPAHRYPHPQIGRSAAYGLTAEWRRMPRDSAVPRAVPHQPLPSSRHTATVTALTGRAEDLVVRRSRRRQLPNLLGLLGFFVFCAFGGFTGFGTGWVVALGLAVFTVALGIGLVDFARSGPGSAALLRLGPAGVEIPDVATVAWSDLDDVRVVATRWPLGNSVVAFVPRAGVTLPTIPRSQLSTGAMRGTPAALTSRYGSPLVLLPQPTTATAQDVLDAVTRFGGPMRHRR